jgi:hypothetical protein
VAFTNEIADFFSPVGARYSRFRAETDGTNHFRIVLDSPASYTASDYLAWSDQFTNDFDFIREGLTRPAARIHPGDRDSTQPRNFVALRILAQTLGQRAQSELLLGQPAGAARDLALLKDLPRLFAESPTNLVQGMIEVAVQGIYLDACAPGGSRNSQRCKHNSGISICSRWSGMESRRKQPPPAALWQRGVFRRSSGMLPTSPTVVSPRKASKDGRESNVAL